MYLVLWQKGLVEREINELLRGLAREDANERNKSNHRRKTKVKKTTRILFSHSYPPPPPPELFQERRSC